MSPELDSDLERLAQAPVLLVASDYDGTLAPIVEDPSAARPERDAIVALRSLAALPNTHVAVISGRAIRDLVALTGLPETVHLVGSHGTEFDLDFGDGLSREQTERLATVAAALREVAGRAEGFLLEEKPAGVAFHYRSAAPEDARAAVEAIEAGPATWEGVFPKRGKMVLELTIVPTSKGEALARVRRQLGPSAVLFFGDDRTDEDAFAILEGPDLGVKVGEGASRARLRVEDARAVTRVLGHLYERRASWMAGDGAAPIEDHSLLSDQRAAGLVGPDGRVVWLCVPRIDSPPLFAELLGGPAAGRFAVHPAGEPGTPCQRYRPSSMVLETVWPSLTVTDYLDCSGVRPRSRPGRSELVRVLEGTGPVEVVFAPRLDFGRTPTRLRVRENGLEVQDWIDPIVLVAPGVQWTLRREGQHDTATARLALEAGQPLAMELRFGTASLRPTRQPVHDRTRLTEGFWRSWADQLAVPAAYADLVRTSALALKALCHGPSGAIAAAATTSLPEHRGGTRNWDYRFCWPRDAAMAGTSLARLGSVQEAMRFLDWVLDILDHLDSPERLRPVYTVGGGEVPAEAEIMELPGYAGSRPVRVGNLAANQVQLDIFGPICRLVRVLVECEAPVSSEHWRLTEALVAAVRKRWTEPDHGIWEVRLVPHHHVHSKVMCWQTVQCAVEIADAFLERPPTDWLELRDTIRDEILDRGWNERVGAFTGVYGQDALDAAALWVGLSGLLPPSDPRFAATVQAVDTHLRDGPTVYRYRTDDGLPGREGGWFLCMGWLIEAWASMGRTDVAKARLDDLLSIVGSTGLAPEQHDPERGTGLGNHPQAYSHLAIIDAVLCIAANHDA